MDILKFDPLTDKSPIGTISAGENIEFKVCFNENLSNSLKSEIYSVALMIREDRENDYTFLDMKPEKNFFIVNYNFNSLGHYFYNFKVNYSDKIVYINKTYDNYSVMSQEKGEDFVQIVTSEKYDCNNSLQGGLVYQIMVDRFCRVGKVKPREPLLLRNDWGGDVKKITQDPKELNTQVFGGNFKGVISKLDYLSELGVTAIYFTPISLASSHHKYDTADYLKIDDMLGSESEFKKLVKLAKEKNIKIIIDGVYNHTGSDSIYFNKESRFESIGAYNSTNSDYYNWYSFTEFPEKYDCWWGIDTLPSIKKDNENYQNFIAGKNGVIEKFFGYGIFGIRLDVVDELSDEFVKKISNKIRSFGKDCACIGEVWEDASTKISYGKRRNYFTNNELNSVMNYPLRDAILNYIATKNPYNLSSTVRMILNNYPKMVLDNLLCSLGTHDTSRFFSEIKTICGLDGYDIDLKNLTIKSEKNIYSLKNYKLRLSNYYKSKSNYTDKLSSSFFNDFSDYGGFELSDNNIVSSEFIADNDESILILEKFDKLIRLLKIGFTLIFTLLGVTTIFYGDEYGMDNSSGNPRGCFDWDNYDNEIYRFIRRLSKIRKRSVFKDGNLKVLLSKDGKFVFSRSNDTTEIFVFINLGQSNLLVDLKGKFKSMLCGEKYSKINLNENEFEILISEKL